MLLKKPFAKTHNFFNRSLQNLKTFIFGGYKRLPKAPSFNPFSCSSRRSHKDHQFDPYYPEFLEEVEPGQDNAKTEMEKNIVSMKEPMKEGVESPVKIKEEERGGKTEKKTGNSNAGSQSGKPYLKKENGGNYWLAQKMKEMEMMDVGNVDHVLDIEEVLHYYSRLKSPVYLDIVDKFFTDMHSEILYPQPSVSKNNSKRRLRPIKLYKP